MATVSPLLDDSAAGPICPAPAASPDVANGHHPTGPHEGELGPFSVPEDEWGEHEAIWESIFDKQRTGEPLTPQEQAAWDEDEAKGPGPSELLDQEAGELSELMFWWSGSYCPEGPPTGHVDIPNAVLADPTLSPAAKIYASILLGHKGPHGTIPGEQRLSWLLDCTDRQVRKLNAGLVARGLLRIETRPGRSNAYTVLATATKKDGWTCVPRAVLYDRFLDPGERLAFCLVAYFQRQDDACVHPVRELAALAGVGRQTFHAWLERLTMLHLVENTPPSEPWRKAAGRRTGDTERAADLVRRNIALNLFVWQFPYAPTKVMRAARRKAKD